MSTRPPDPRLLGFLSAYDRLIAELALGLRELALEQAPESIESIYDAYNAVAIGFSFTGRLKDSFCHIATYAKHVNLGFNRGASLADPHGVLRGNGKAIRHVRIAETRDLEAPFLERYLQAAMAQVGGRPETNQNAPPSTESPKVVVKGNYPTKRRPNR